MMICDKKLIIGLAGEMGCGKGTVANYIKEKYGGVAYRFSTPLRDVLDRLYLPHVRENTSGISTILRKKFGDDLLSKVIFHDVQKEKNSIIAVDGVRRKEDIIYLKTLSYFKLVYFDVDIKKRFERINKRGENPDDKTKTFEQFKKDHELETELRIRALRNIADYVVDNNGYLANFYGQIDKIIEQLCE